MTASRHARAILLAALAAAATAACGKKGPPLPPLIQLPNPPGDFTVVRRGPDVVLSFKIPNANSDRSTPADITRVDVFEWTVPGAVTADDVVRRGTRIGTVRVNAPKDPDEPEPAAEDPAREGVEQDTVATVTDPLAADADAQGGYRAYVAVGFNGRGRRGMLSPRVSLPLVPLPPPPGEPRVSYDEKAITVTWPPAAPADGTTFTYTVYRPDPVALLTPTPVRNAQFVDESIEWDAERCYEVRTVATVEGVRIESLPSAPHCVTLQDTFAPKKPEGLVGVGSESAISLIWTANTEVDLAGYVVLRAIEPATQLTPVTPAPIADTNYRDTVPAGSRVTYAVLAVDKAGNRSAPSDRITETAR